MSSAKATQKRTLEVFFERSLRGRRQHQATVVKVEGGRCHHRFAYGLEGTCHAKHLVKQDGSTLGVDGQDDFVVLEFNRNAKRITVSHLRTCTKKDLPRLTSSKKPRSSGGGGGSTRMMDEVNASVEKSTFGDLDVLTALKEQMVDNPAEAQDAKEEVKEAKETKYIEVVKKKVLQEEGGSQEKEEAPAGGTCKSGGGS